MKHINEIGKAATVGDKKSECKRGRVEAQSQNAAEEKGVASRMGGENAGSQTSR